MHKDRPGSIHTLNHQVAQVATAKPGGSYRRYLNKILEFHLFLCKHKPMALFALEIKTSSTVLLPPEEENLPGGKKKSFYKFQKRPLPPPGPQFRDGNNRMVHKSKPKDRLAAVEPLSYIPEKYSPLMKQ